MKKILTALFIVLSIATTSNALTGNEEHFTEVKAFVARFYTKALGREADEGGSNYWTRILLEQSASGADVAKGFIFSKEFLKKNTTDIEYINILYHTFFNREGDLGGVEHWLNLLELGTDRKFVLDGFLESKEFYTLAESFGIRPTLSFINNHKVKEFVERFYTKALDRNGEAAGIEHWSNKLISQELAAVDVARGFIFSKEFIEKNTTDLEYIKILYRTFFDREGEAGGVEHWLNKLAAGIDRKIILDGFINSNEFYTLAESFGIRPTTGTTYIDRPYQPRR